MKMRRWCAEKLSVIARFTARLGAVIREALASARSQPVASIVSIVMVAGMCATVVLTTGRTVGAEREVLGSIDSAGTRSIVIRADAEAGLDTRVLDRLAVIEGIAWVGAFGAAQDVTNVSVPGGTQVPLRLMWGDRLDVLGIPQGQPVADRTGWASAVALDQLGMPDQSGGVVSEAGADYAIAGQLVVPGYLTLLEPLVVVPQSGEAEDPQPVSVLVVIAARPDLVTPVAKAVQTLLAVDDPTKVNLSTSESFASLRAVIERQLGSFGRDLVIVIFAVTALLVAAIQFGLVALRRKDFGRRRALGASQALIISLLLTQMATLSIVGATIGCAAAALGLAATGDPLPGPEFFIAVSILAVAVATLAAVLPAMAAARKDPLKELRVP